MSSKCRPRTPEGSFVCVCRCFSFTRRPLGTRMYSVHLLSRFVSGMRARAHARVHDDPFSPPPLHFKNVKEPFASTVRGSMKPGPSPRPVVKSGNSVSTTLASAALGLRGGSPCERLPSGGWWGVLIERDIFFLGGDDFFNVSCGK